MARAELAIHAIFPSIPAPRAARPASPAGAPASAPAAASAGASASAAASPDDGFSFDDFVDMVNPLQHIPVVGTLYRAITGDKMNTAPKILGDTLYGGVTGFVSSVADTIFEKITGKSVGDTILGYAEELFSPDKPATGVADASSAAPALPSPDKLAAIDTGTNLVTYVPSLPTAEAPAQVQPAEQSAIVVPGQDELLMALSRNGIGQDVALRAADAYRRTLSAAQASALQ